MALYIDNKSCNTIYRGHSNVQAVYQGLKLIWQYIKSCFGRGYWINSKEWSQSDAWDN